MYRFDLLVHYESLDAFFQFSDILLFFKVTFSKTQRLFASSRMKTGSHQQFFDIQPDAVPTTRLMLQLERNHVL